MARTDKSALERSAFSPVQKDEEIKQLRKQLEEEQRDNEKKLVAASTKLEMKEEELKQANQRLKEIQEQHQTLLIRSVHTEKELELLKKQFGELQQKHKTLKGDAKEQEMQSVVRTTIQMLRNDGSIYAKPSQAQLTKPRESRIAGQKTVKVRNKLVEDFKDMGAYWSPQRRAYIAVLSFILGGMGDALTKLVKHLPPSDPLTKCLQHCLAQSMPMVTLQESSGLQARLTSMVIGLVLEDDKYSPDKVDTDLRAQASASAEKSSANMKTYYGKIVGILSGMDHKMQDPIPRKKDLRSLDSDALKIQLGKDSKLLHISREAIVGTAIFPPASFGEFHTIGTQLQSRCEDIEAAQSAALGK